MPKKIDLNDTYFLEYKDRGILKWQGMFLSEHTASINKVKEMEIEPSRLSQQASSEIDYYLEQSIKYNKVLSIQLNSLDGLGRTKKDIVGVFRGFVDQETLLINDEYISLDDIRHIQMKNFQKWNETAENPFVDIKISTTNDFNQDIDDFFEAYFIDDFYDDGLEEKEED